jgi:hypothetical protein
MREEVADFVSRQFDHRQRVGAIEEKHFLEVPQRDARGNEVIDSERTGVDEGKIDPGRPLEGICDEVAEIGAARSQRRIGCVELRRRARKIGDEEVAMRSKPGRELRQPARSRPLRGRSGLYAAQSIGCESALKPDPGQNCSK